MMDSGQLVNWWCPVNTWHEAKANGTLWSPDTGHAKELGKRSLKMNSELLGNINLKVTKHQIHKNKEIVEQNKFQEDSINVETKRLRPTWNDGDAFGSLVRKIHTHGRSLRAL